MEMIRKNEEKYRKEKQFIKHRFSEKTLLLAKRITDLLKNEDIFYFTRGKINNSYVANQMGIHRNDVSWMDIPEEITYGINGDALKSINIVVSIDQYFEVVKKVQYELEKEYKTINLAEKTKNGLDAILMGTFICTKQESLLSKVKLLERDANKIPCLYQNDLDVKEDEYIKVSIRSDYRTSFLNDMNKIENINNIANDNISYLKKMFEKDCFSFLPLGVQKIYKTVYKEIDDMQLSDFEMLANHTLSQRTFNVTKQSDIEFSGKTKMFRELTKYMSKSEALKLCESQDINREFDEKTPEKLPPNVVKAIKTTYSLANDGDAFQMNSIFSYIAYYLYSFPNAYKSFLERKYPSITFDKNNIARCNKYDAANSKSLFMDYMSKIEDRYIGIFFVIDGVLRTYKEKLVVDSNYPNYDVDKSHLELFDSYHLDEELEYSMFPRGRIIYFDDNNTFVVYADRTILKNNKLKDQIIKEFNLPAFNVVFKGDEHYRTLKY